MSYYIAPVIVTLLSVFLLKESINKKTLVAVGLSFSGVVLMILMGSQKGKGKMKRISKIIFLIQKKESHNSSLFKYI